MKAILFFALCTILTIPTVFGQIKIGENPQNIDPSSVLELESSSKVLVITRVSTLEMDAITPQRGGMVYNTDTECIHYYDGTRWINLCDAVDFEVTSDPIVNNRVTISITESEQGYNLEVAKNSILGENIVDGGIGPDDIQDNSIGQDKLAAESVGSSEIRQNAVGSDEIRDGSIVPTDIANFIPRQVLTTDENGIAQWEDANNLQGAIGDEVTITGGGTIENPLALTETIQLNITDNTTTIADHILEDGDTDATNELTDLAYNLTTNVLSLSRSENGTAVDLSDFATDDDLINGLGLKEDISNKDSNPSLGTSDINYPTQNAVKTYVDSQVGVINTLGEANIYLGDATGNAQEVQISGDATMNNTGFLTIADNAITSNKIQNGEVTTEDINDAAITNNKLDKNTIPLSGFQAAGANVDLGGFNLINVLDPVNLQDAATRNYVDSQVGGINTLGNANIYVGDATGNAQEVQISGDATMDNTGLLTIADNAITSNNIQNGEVTTEDINDAAITNDKLDKNTIPLSGFQAASSNVDLGSFNLINVLDPINLQDAATRNYVDTEIANIVSSGGSDPINEQNTAFEVVGGNLILTDISGTFNVPLTDIDTNTQLTDAEIEAFGYIKIDNDNQTLIEVLTQDNDANGTTITNLPTPSLDSDAATKEYVDNEIAALPAGSDNQQLTLEPGNLLTLTNSAPPINLTPFLNNQTSAEVPVTATPVNYTPTAANVEGHLEGIDVALIGTGSQDLASVLTNGTSAGNNQIKDLLDPSLDQDAATKKYVDDNIVAAGGGVPTDELITAFNLNTTTLSITEDGFVWPVDLDTSFATDEELTTATTTNALAIATNTTALDDKEDSANKSNDINLADPTDTKFPTELAVKTYVDNQIATVGDDDITAVNFDGTNLTVEEGTTTFFANLSDLEESTDILAVQADVDLNEADADAAIASVQADVDLNEADADTAIALKEDSANKSNDINLADPTDTKFPTELAVKTYVDNQIATVGDDDITAVNFDGTNLTVEEGTTTFFANLSDLEESTDILAVQADVDLNEADADAAIASVQADVDLNEADADTAIALKEDSANKSNDINLADPTDTKFPTELAVKTYVDNQIATVGDDDITAVNFDGTNLTVEEGTTTFFANLSDLEESTDILAVQADVDLNEADADAAIASVQADVDLNEADADTAIALKEDSANKSNDINLADPTDTKFPTELAVKTYVDNQIATVGDDDITAVNFDGTNLTVEEGTTTFFANLSDLEESTDILAVQADVDLNEADADAAIASVQADVDLNEADADTAIALKEDSANKSNDINLADPTDTKFPTELAVKTYVDNQIATVGVTITTDATLTGDGDVNPLGIAPGAVTGGTGGIIADGTITTDDLGDNAVTEAKIAPGANGTVLTSIGGVTQWAAPATSGGIIAMGKVDLNGNGLKLQNSTVTQNGTGSYTVNLTPVMADANYIINLTVSASSGTASPPIIKVIAQTTTSFTVEILSINNGGQNNFTLTDSAWFYSVMDF